MTVRSWVLTLALLGLAVSVASCGEIRCKTERLGHPVAGARVVLEPGAVMQTTDAAGECNFPGLAAGQYVVRATKVIGGDLYGAVSAEITLGADTTVPIGLTLVRAIELSRYLPVAVGDHWQYRVTITEGGVVTHKTRREKGVGTEVIGGDTAVVVEVTYSPAGDTRKDTMRSGSDGHTRYGEASAADTMNYVPPMHFSNLWPLGYVETVKCTMRHSSGAPDETLEMSGVMRGFEDVTVPAGAFRDCARLEFVQRTGAEVRRLTLWLARGVGTVRSEERAPGKEHKQVLEEYRVAARLRPLVPAPLRPIP